MQKYQKMGKIKTKNSFFVEYGIFGNLANFLEEIEGVPATF